MFKTYSRVQLIGQLGNKVKSISLLVMIASLTTMGFASNQAFAGFEDLLPNNPANKDDPFLGDFMCYDVTNVEHFKDDVILTDQFIAGFEYDIEDIIKICTMVFKEQGIDFPESPLPQIFDSEVDEQHFVVYRLCEQSSDIDSGGTCIPPDPVDFPVSITDQFGTTDHELPHQPVELWVPAEKEDNGDIFLKANNIHFICYDIEPQFIGTKSLTLFNENFAVSGVSRQIDTATKLCNPVLKNEEPNQSLEIEHLKCYEFISPQTFPDVNVKTFDQFHSFFAGQDLTVTDEVEFCSAADKSPITGPAVGGTLIPIDTTALLLTSSQMTASWLIPVIVAGAGIGLVFVRKSENS